MDEKKQYWPNELETVAPFGAVFELRAAMAWELVVRYGSVAGKLDGEDTHGRARLGLQTPEELVERCFKIADLYVDTAEARGLLHAPTLTQADKLKARLEQEEIARDAACQAFDKRRKERQEHGSQE